MLNVDVVNLFHDVKDLNLTNRFVHRWISPVAIAKIKINEKTATLLQKNDSRMIKRWFLPVKIAFDSDFL